MLVAFNLILRECEVGSRSIADHKRHAHRIGTVFIGDLKRIHNVALAFAHLLTLLIVHETVKIDGMERYFLGKIESEKYHSWDPFEYQVMAAFHNGSRVECFEVCAVG